MYRSSLAISVSSLYVGIVLIIVFIACADMAQMAGTDGVDFQRVALLEEPGLELDVIYSKNGARDRIGDMYPFKDHPIASLRQREIHERLIPSPASVEREDGGTLALSSLHADVLSVTIQSTEGELKHTVIDDAVERFKDRIKAWVRQEEGVDAVSPVTLAITCAHARGRSGEQPYLPHQDSDESYRLHVTQDSVAIEAREVAGVLHALETLFALIHGHARQGDTGILPIVITDQPALSWRGLMLDVSRHFIELDVIKRNIDAMAHVKLNVLHLHLSDDHGFRFECRALPRLHRVGGLQNASPGFYTQDQLRDLVRYAASRGVRIVPEFDVPGHAAAFLAAYPEYGSSDKGYKVLDVWGINQPDIDPTNENVYTALRTLFQEVAAVFPDPYLHIGGDEVDPTEWRENAKIRDYMRQHSLADYRDLQLHFNLRLMSEVLSDPAVNRTMIGWDEILTHKLDRAAVIHSWQGRDSLIRAARLGFQSILSAGYYLDHMHPAREHYLIHPHDRVPAGQGRGLIMGGEACMWSEYADNNGIEGKVWPRVGAVAERLWTPLGTPQHGGMFAVLTALYDKLDVLSERLESCLGLLHLQGHRNLLDALYRQHMGLSDTGPVPDAFHVLAHALQPKNRVQTPSYTQGTPLTGLVDAIAPESVTARRFNTWVTHLVSFLRGNAKLQVHRATVRQLLLALLQCTRAWSAQLNDNHRALQSMGQEEVAVASALAECAEVGEQHVRYILALVDGTGDQTPPRTRWHAKWDRPIGLIHIAVAPGLKQVVHLATSLRPSDFVKEDL